MLYNVCVCPVKALLPSLGSAPQWVFALPRPCGGGLGSYAQAVWPGGGGGMTSGFQITSMVLTPCQTAAVPKGGGE